MFPVVVEFSVLSISLHGLQVLSLLFCSYWTHCAIEYAPYLHTIDAKSTCLYISMMPLANAIAHKPTALNCRGTACQKCVRMHHEMLKPLSSVKKRTCYFSAFKGPCLPLVESPQPKAAPAVSTTQVKDSVFISSESKTNRQLLKQNDPSWQTQSSRDSGSSSQPFWGTGHDHQNLEEHILILFQVGSILLQPLPEGLLGPLRLLSLAVQISEALPNLRRIGPECD